MPGAYGTRRVKTPVGRWQIVKKRKKKKRKNDSYRHNGQQANNRATRKRRTTLLSAPRDVIFAADGGEIRRTQTPVAVTGPSGVTRARRNNKLLLSAAEVGADHFPPTPPPPTRTRGVRRSDRRDARLPYRTMTVAIVVFTAFRDRLSADSTPKGHQFYWNRSPRNTAALIDLYLPIAYDESVLNNSAPDAFLLAADAHAACAMQLKLSQGGVGADVKPQIPRELTLVVYKS